MVISGSRIGSPTNRGRTRHASETGHDHDETGGSQYREGRQPYTQAGSEHNEEGEPDDEGLGEEGQKEGDPDDP